MKPEHTASGVLICIIMVLLFASLALGFTTTSGGGGICMNNHIVVEPNGVGVIGCQTCLNEGGGTTDPGLADCRQCCQQLNGGFGTPAARACQFTAGC